MLPSRYAPEGLSYEQSKKTITVGHKPHRSNLVLRRLEQRINEYDQADEMMDIDYDEAYMISDYVTASRLYEVVGNQISSPHQTFENVNNRMKDQLIGDHGEPSYSYLIIDTNFALSNLKLLNEIKELSDKYKLKIIFPIATMEELDGLKQSKKVFEDQHQDENGDRLNGKTIGILARRANDWIYNNLAIGSAVKGQQLKQRIDKFAIKDDGILDCCVYFKSNFKNNLIVLFSNDKNLCMKALSNDILTVSFKRDMTADLICKKIYDECLSSYPVNNFKVNDFDSHTTSTNSHMDLDGDYMKSAAPLLQNSSEVQIPPHSQNSVREIISPTIEDIPNFVYNEIFMLTKSVIKHAMEEAYGEDLDIIVNYNPENIHDIQDCYEVIERYWTPVFQIFLGSRNQFKDIEYLLPRSKAGIIEFVNDWSMILTKLYSELLDKRQQDALKKMINRWTNLVDNI